MDDGSGGGGLRDPRSTLGMTTTTGGASTRRTLAKVVHLEVAGGVNGGSGIVGFGDNRSVGMPRRGRREVHGAVAGSGWSDLEAAGSGTARSGVVGGSSFSAPVHWLGPPCHCFIGSPQHLDLNELAQFAASCSTR